MWVRVGWLLVCMCGLLVALPFTYPTLHFFYISILASSSKLHGHTRAKNRPHPLILPTLIFPDLTLFQQQALLVQ